MKNNLILLPTTLLCVIPLGLSARDAKKSDKAPNIILFMVDDMGWQDCSEPFWDKRTHFNDTYKTPNLERLASKGVKFTRAYSSAVSSPTRTSLMTGMNPAAHRVTNWTLHKDKTTDHKTMNINLPDWNYNGLQPVGSNINNSVEATTFVQILKENGYHTIHCGKAHWGAISTPGEDPLNLGFDINIAGHAAGGPASYLGKENFGYDENGVAKNPFAIPGLEKYWGEDIFVTEALTIEAKKALDESLKTDKPFYLYMSHYAIHVPLNKDDRYYQSYIDAGLDDKEARYASLIEGMDKSLGDLMDYIEQKGISDNTIIIFTSDNGGLSASNRSGIKDTHNYPLASGKGSANEGGIRVPMIISMPLVERGVCNTPVEVCDFLPTIADMAGIKKYNTLQEIDGLTLMPLLEGKVSRKYNRALYWHYPNNWGPKGKGIGTTSSILRDDWKLIYYYEDGRTELFNLKNDISESKDLASNLQYHSIKTSLAEDLSNYLRSKKAQLPTDKTTNKQCKYPDGV